MPAQIATAEKIINACNAKVTPKKIICRLGDAEKFTNWGKKAKKNNKTFGFSTFINTPRRYSLPKEIRASDFCMEIFLPARAAVKDLNAKNIKYAAPKIFSAVKATGELCTNAATPIITKNV